ncbi:MAG: response regulator [Shimia sp.]
MRKFSLVVVDDDPEDTFAMRRAFEKEGVDVDIRHLEDGEKLLKALSSPFDDENPRPDFILLDINMPGPSGLEVLERMRRTDAGADIPVIVVTTSDAEKDVQEAYRLGANAYVVKPTSMGQLAAFARSFGLFWIDCARLPTR